MMRLPKYHIILIILLLAVARQAGAQRINFGLYAQDDIILTPLLTELDFNASQAVIVSGDAAINIGLNDPISVLIEVDANEEYDLDVLIDAPYSVELTVGAQVYHIPLRIEIAYTNTGVAATDARSHATLVPSGFRAITFPALRRQTNAPAPPPTPGHSSYDQARTKAYLIIYGTLGPVPLNIPSGEYSATINLTVSYSSSISTP